MKLSIAHLVVATSGVHVDAQKGSSSDSIHELIIARGGRPEMMTSFGEELSLHCI